MPKPAKTVLAVAPPVSPITSTSAQAVPSGNFSMPCCLTQNARRSGIIIKMPSRPPKTETTITRVHSISNPRIITAGMVTPTPKAIDSPAEPVVWTMLFSRMRRPAEAERVGEAPEERDRQHGHGDRGRDGHAHLQHQVERRGAEDDAQDGPHQHRRPGELRQRGLIGDVGLMCGGRLGERQGRPWR